MAIRAAILMLVALASVINAETDATRPVNGTVVHQFPSGYALENLIARANGQLVVTVNTPPLVYQVDPTGNQPAFLIHNFTQTSSCGGIVELQPDVFAIATGNASAYPTLYGKMNTWGIWKVDLRNFTTPADASKIVVQELLAVPEALDLDGLGLINQTQGLIAAADYVSGAIRLINLSTKTSSVLSNSTLLKGVPNANLTTNPLGPMGANGLKYVNSTVFFTTTGKGLYGKIPVSSSSGIATGPPQILFNYTTNTTLDDFNFAPNGNLYLSTLLTPNGGIFRRPYDTPIGVNGSTVVVSSVGTGAVILNQTSPACQLYFLNGVSSTVNVATLAGPC